MRDVAFTTAGETWQSVDSFVFTNMKERIE